MNLPKSYREIIEKKLAYMQRQENLLGKDVLKYQSSILNNLIKTLYSEMDVTGGVIKNTTKNYRIMGEVNRVIKDVETANSQIIASHIGRGMENLNKLNINYFSLAIGASKKLERVAGQTANKMAARVGYVGDRLIKGGFLDNVLGADDIIASANNLITKAVSAQVNMKDMVSQLTDLIDGGDNLGLMERKFDRLSFDIFQQYDAAYAGQIAQEVDLKYFLYQGGLIEDTRDFCREHNGRVWSVEESEDWSTWTPSKAKFITEFKQKDIYSVPSYIDYAGYQPLIDRGGYNCRHAIGYITDSMAFRLRPDLEES